ncbi:MAG: glutaredoxin family protein [Nitrospinaceae bacterium]
MPFPLVLEILTKNDCCLCDEAKATVQEVLKDYPGKLIITDIESDPELFERYKEKIPVLRINGEDSFTFKVHPVTLHKKLARLRQRGHKGIESFAEE